MPQMQLPIFPEGVSQITNELAVKKEDGVVVYFNGHMPVFTHAEDDLASFKMITSQFCVNGNAEQVDICRTFGVTKALIKRAIKLYRTQGPKGFYQPRNTREGAVLTAKVLPQVQAQLDMGKSVSEIAQAFDIKRDTLKKAIAQGRLKKKEFAECESHKSDFSTTTSSTSVDSSLPSSTPLTPATSKSERNIVDAECPMGVATTNTLERVAASMGLLPDGATIDFKPSLDVPNGGVLCALPALLASGLLAHTKENFSEFNGYYRLDTLFIFLAFMALCRLKSMESLRYNSPGEWGKLVGLDRIPEVRTLRKKVHQLTDTGKVQAWSSTLCADWMAAAPDASMVLYADGHVRVYHGAQTKLPKHYVSRERLCLHATTDYWVNAMDGQPYLVINKTIDPGLIQVLKTEIIPRLITEAPRQPSAEALKADPLLHRFTLVFDREGYSPSFWLELREARVAILSYNKFPKKDWPVEEFQTVTVTLASGEQVPMLLAERGTYVSQCLWVREIRKCSESGHQTSILSTDYRSNAHTLAGLLFARWSQENFFRYMKEHFGLDRLLSYLTEDIPGTTKVVNPAYRTLDGEIRKKAAALSRKQAAFGALSLSDTIEPKAVECYQQKKAALQETIEQLTLELNTLKAKRKETKRHILFEELPEEKRFKQLCPASKHFIDVIKMIAYRAETAMANTLKEKMSREMDARSLLRGLYQTEADIIPDPNKEQLTIRLHHLANHSNDAAINFLFSTLNETETIFTGTNLKLFFEWGSSQFPTDQEF